MRAIVSAALVAAVCVPRGASGAAPNQWQDHTFNAPVRAYNRSDPFPLDGRYRFRTI